MAQILPNGRNQFFDDNGDPLVGGKLYTYEPGPGITIPKNTYFDADATTPHTNPIILDARGEATIFWDGGYNIRLEDAQGGLIYTVEEITTADRPIFTDLANTSDPAKGDALIGVKKTGLLATTQHNVNEARWVSVQADCGGIPNGTTQTSAVQLALDSLPAWGGTIVVEFNIKFDLKALTFPARFIMYFRIDDDVSRAGMGFEPGSGEIVRLFSTSSYPVDPNGGYVCEDRLTTPLQAGYVADTRKDLIAATPYLGPGQTLDNPVRMSYNGQDEQTDRFRWVGEFYRDYSHFSGHFIHGWQSFTTMTGIGTQDYTPVPAVGSTLTGTVSGARGFFVYAEGTPASLSVARYGNTYTVTVEGTTLWTAFGAASNAPGTVFTYQAPNNVSGGAFTIGKSYAIVAANDTDFTACGAADNLIGTVFTATGSGLPPPATTPGLALPQFGTGTCTGERKTVINWQGKRFQVGDALVYTSGTTPTVATAWSPASSRFQELSQATQGGGAWTLGDRPPGVGTEAFNLSGNIIVVPTRNGSVIIPKRVLKPKVLLGDSPENVTPHKIGFGYNPGDQRALAYRRLFSTRSEVGDGETWRGEWVPVSAQINFTNTIAIGLQSVNIRKMTRVAAGRYAFEFLYPLSRVDYSVNFGKDGFFMIGWDVGLVFPTAVGCEVRVYNAAGALTDIPAGGFVSMTLTGGDT